jgi:hypothetical protein
MKILPFLSRGIVLLHEDGMTFEMAPLQVFRGPGGGVVIRIGRNALFFNNEGRFDGSECKLEPIDPSAPEAKAIMEAVHSQQENKNCAPDSPYFQPGSALYLAETRVWPPKN